MNLLLHNLTSHGHESGFDIRRVLGRSLHKLNAEAISKLLSSLVGNNLLGGQIGLITNQKLHNILTGIAVNFMKPGLHIVEGILISNVINDDNSMSTTVVAGSDGSESLLTSSIPLDVSQPPRTKIQSEASQSFHQGQRCGSSTPSYIIGDHYEIDTNGGNIAIRILVISETQQQTGLTDTRISNEEKLEKIVATHRLRPELSKPFKFILLFRVHGFWTMKIYLHMVNFNSQQQPQKAVQTPDHPDYIKLHHTLIIQHLHLLISVN